jgi:hypothetical protein
MLWIWFGGVLDDFFHGVQLLFQHHCQVNTRNIVYGASIYNSVDSAPDSDIIFQAIEDNRVRIKELPGKR